MQYSLAALAFAALASAAPQAPPAAASSCSSSHSGTFEISTYNVTSSKRDVEKRTALVLTLSNGILKDAEGRVGYIASNNQFQFDYSVNGGLPQAGAIYTEGWAVCSNNTLVLGTDAVFKQCLSGTFYNLYDEASAQQCSPVYLEVVSSTNGAASQGSDGQVTATPVASQLPDGQVTASPVSQISDGQIQNPTGVVSQISDGQIQNPTGVVSQISDGQIQNPTGVVSQISDGQIQNPTGVVSQISDGQIQNPTGAVSQISDGQPQAPKTTAKATTSSRVVSPITQISDGQIQAPTGGATISRNATSVRPSASVTVQPYTGAANLPLVGAEFFGLAAGVLALAML